MSWKVYFTINIIKQEDICTSYFINPVGTVNAAKQINH